jgi:hypothetical protein
MGEGNWAVVSLPKAITTEGTKVHEGKPDAWRLEALGGRCSVPDAASRVSTGGLGRDKSEDQRI